MITLPKDLKTYCKRVLISGPDRVIVSAEAAAMPPSRAWEEKRIVPDITFIRRDGWSLGAPREFETVAYQQWPDDWIGFIRRGQFRPTVIALYRQHKIPAKCPSALRAQMSHLGKRSWEMRKAKWVAWQEQHGIVIPDGWEQTPWICPLCGNYALLKPTGEDDMCSVGDDVMCIQGLIGRCPAKGHVEASKAPGEAVVKWDKPISASGPSQSEG